MKKRAFDRRWAIPLAATIPFFASVFAFSLGPDPSKRLARFEASSEHGEALLAPLRAAGDAVIPLLLISLLRTDMPHRAEAIDHLVEVKATAAVPTLATIISRERETASIREHALLALAALDPARARLLAAALAGRADVLGEVARKLL